MNQQKIDDILDGGIVFMGLALLVLPFVVLFCVCNRLFGDD